MNNACNITSPSGSEGMRGNRTGGQLTKRRTISRVIVVFFCWGVFWGLLWCTAAKIVLKGKEPSAFWRKDPQKKKKKK